MKTVQRQISAENFDVRDHSDEDYRFSLIKYCLPVQPILVYTIPVDGMLIKTDQTHTTVSRHW
jgi:hypothetical protein